MVKVYEFAKDQYVMFSPEVLKAMEEVGTHSVEITQLVPLKTVDPVYFDKAYYLGPDKGGAKPYALLARALRESGCFFQAEDGIRDVAVTGVQTCALPI